MPPPKRNAPVPPASGIRDSFHSTLASPFRRNRPGPQPQIGDVAALLVADADAPIRARVAAACHLHRRRWGLPRWLPDDRAVQQAYARRQAEVGAVAAAYARGWVR